MAAPLVCRSAIYSVWRRACKWQIKQISRKNSHFTVKEAIEGKQFDKDIRVKGWVKTLQSHKGVLFLHVSDGSSPKHLQVVVPKSMVNTVEATFGSCVDIKGVLVESEGKGQNVELLSSSVIVVGPCDTFEYPLKQRARHPPHYTRDFLHFRPRTNIFSALLRIRNAASMAVHSYFQDEGYMFIHTPLLVTNDCEGGCQVFKVEPDMPQSINDDSDSDEFSSGPQNDLEQQMKMTSSTEQHFFGQPAYLTVSGQLHLEIMTGALTKVYNFSPCFRAENSAGSYHLSEFYMVEAELAFIDHLEPLMGVMENLIKHVYKTIMNKCQEDVALFTKYVSPENHETLFASMMESQFERMTYSEAIDILKKSSENFKQSVSWGSDLHKEHELYLTKWVGDKPVFVTDYPADLKPFYALRNSDSLTVAASDLLMPFVGELCGSSLREHRLGVLKQVLSQEEHLLSQMKWYTELREFGTCPHGGFGLGFERLLVAMLGAASVKDVIPFPRWTGRCLT